MRKILNWSLGGFFRTIGRFFAYFVIGVLIILIGAKIGFKSFLMPIKAATSGLEKYDYRFWPVSCSAQGRNCILGPGSGFLNKGDYYDLSAQYSSILQFNLRTWAGSNIYKENNTYTFRYTVQVANKTTLLDNIENINKSVKFIEMYTATASSPSNATQDDMNIDIKFTDATGSTDKVYLYIKFSPNKDIKWWGVTFQVGREGGNITEFPFSDVEKIRYINAVVTYEEGVNAIIDKKTDEIIKGQDKIKDSITSTSDNDEDESCGIICKLKSIVKFLKPTSLANIIVPNEDQMHDLIDTMQTQVTTKLGILAFPITLYTQIIDLVQNVNDSNWCFTWDPVKVPNFEDSVIIEAGEFCFSTILQNEKINSFRTLCHFIIGGLILLAFVQYLRNCANKVLDVPDRSDYTYITTTTTTFYTYDHSTGEAIPVPDKSKISEKVRTRQ